MKEDTNFADILKKFLKDTNYIELITKITKKYNNSGIGLDNFFEDIFNKHCFIILMIGMAKKVEVDKFVFRSGTHIIEIDSIEFAKEYEKYIKLIEKQKMKIVKEII